MKKNNINSYQRYSKNTYRHTVN